MGSISSSSKFKVQFQGYVVKNSSMFYNTEPEERPGGFKDTTTSFSYCYYSADTVAVEKQKTVAEFFQNRSICLSNLI